MWASLHALEKLSQWGFLGQENGDEKISDVNLKELTKVHIKGNTTIIVQVTNMMWDIAEKTLSPLVGFERRIGIPDAPRLVLIMPESPSPSLQ